MKMSNTRFTDVYYLPLSSFAQVELGLLLGLHSLPLVQGQELGLLLPRNLPQDISQLTIYFENISTQTGVPDPEPEVFERGTAYGS